MARHGVGLAQYSCQTRRTGHRGQPQGKRKVTLPKLGKQLGTTIWGLLEAILHRRKQLADNAQRVCAVALTGVAVHHVGPSVHVWAIEGLSLAPTVMLVVLLPLEPGDRVR